MIKWYQGDGGVAVVQHGKTGFAISLGEALSPNEKPRKPASSPKLIPDERITFKGERIANWGTNNDFPQLVLKDCAPSTIIGPVQNFAAELLQGTGINYYLKSKDRQSGEEIKDYTEIPEVEEFLNQSQIDRLYLMEAAKDLVWFSETERR